MISLKTRFQVEARDITMAGIPDSSSTRRTTQPFSKPSTSPSYAAAAYRYWHRIRSIGTFVTSSPDGNWPTGQHAVTCRL